jgi:hypothetical protein
MFRRTAALILAVGGAFAGAYYGVRAVVWSPAAPEVVAPRDPDEPAPPVSAEDASLASAGDASLASAGDASLASAGDASLALIPPRPAPQPAEYRDAAPWLDGGTLPARSGVIVVAPPTDGGAPRVEIDQRDLGAAPVHLVLAEGLHTVRVRDGERWRYQFTTVRAGAAVVLQTSQ